MKEGTRLKLLKQTSSLEIPEEQEQKREEIKDIKPVTRSKFARKLLQAGIHSDARSYAGLSLLCACCAAFLGWQLGPIMGSAAFLAVLHFLFTVYLEERATRRQKKVIPQIAPFIDGLATALATGFNVESAIVQASQAVPPGILRTELDRVSIALTKGFAVKESLSMLRERIAGKEITSLVVSLSLFSSMGGTVLEPLRRLARKIREQQTVTERANRDLVMVKQAFYLLFILSLGIPSILMMIEPNYLKSALNDSFGRIIVQIGGLLILGSVVGFKQITNIKF